METKIDLSLNLEDFNLILQALSVRSNQLRKYPVAADKNRKLLLELRAKKLMSL